MIPSNGEINPYLEQEVLSASPLRLRWMLIRRAEELSMEVERLWMAGDSGQASGWLIRIREILGELLEGVQNRDNPVNQSVSDFYVFLLKLLNQLENSSDLAKLRTLRDLLHLENETWEMVVKKFSGVHSGHDHLAAADHLGLSPETQTEFQLLQTVDDLLDSAGKLNLEI